MGGRNHKPRSLIHTYNFNNLKKARGPSKRPHPGKPVIAYRKCLFCGADGMQSRIYTVDGPENGTEPAAVWRCLVGCGESQPLCRGCFPKVHHQPSVTQLARWDGYHLTESTESITNTCCYSTCRTPEALMARGVLDEMRGGQIKRDEWRAWRATDAVRYAGLIASAIWRRDGRHHQDLYRPVLSVVRRIGNGQRVPDIRESVVGLTSILEAREGDLKIIDHALSVLVCVLAASLIMAVKQPCARDAFWNAIAYAHTAERLADGLLSDGELAEAAIRSQANGWAKGAPVPASLIDAASAAWAIGHRDFARRLVREQARWMAKKTKDSEDF